MRVFDIYYFDIIDKVKFKDTKPYIDNVLNQLGLCYKEITFSYNMFSTPIEKVLELYPNLLKYCFKYEPYAGEKVLTSLIPGWEKGHYYAEKSDWDAIFDIAAKFPDKLRVTGAIAFNQIDWYGNGVKEPAVRRMGINKGKKIAEILQVEPIMNSWIKIKNNFIDSNKHNWVEVIVETIVDESTPKETLDVAMKLEPFFGKYENSRRECRYSLEEGYELYDKSLKCEDLLDEYLRRQFPEEFHEFDFMADFIPKLCDKKKLTLAFKNTGYHLGSKKGLMSTMNHYYGYDKGNHQYEILFDRPEDASDFFYWYIRINGCNFNLGLNQNRAYAADEEEAMSKIVKIAEFCQRFLTEFEPVLTEMFGKTPDWYHYDE